MSSVVQLSKEALQAIEQAGNDCGSGKRGGPRLNYDDLDPKRRKFLERNRQAAARCRERKKQWIVCLLRHSLEVTRVLVSGHWWEGCHYGLSHC